MKNLLLTIAIFISSTATFCQEEFWELLPTPEGVTFWDIEHVIDDILVASSPDSGLYITYDNGDTWQKSAFELGCKDIEAGTNGYVYVHRVSWDQLWFSPDTCKTWIESEQFFSPWVITIHADNNDSVYVGANGRVFRSLDTCKTWQQVMRNPASPYTSDINRNHHTGEIFASFGINGIGDEGLYSSLTGDSGTWVTKNMKNIWCSSIGFDKDGDIYILVL